MSQYQNSPLNNRKSSGYSPQKMGSSINLTDRSKSRMKTQLSPRKGVQNPYTVYHEDKLKVFVKFKPATSPNPRLINVTYMNSSEVEIERQSTNNKIYSYDKVFHESVSSAQVFSTTCMDVIDEVLCDGKYGLIFVYGHTGTGKTYTMGLLDNVNNNSKGIVPESLRYIFKVKEKIEHKYGKNGNDLMKISLSFNQIYMDEVYDMLDFQGEKKLQIREHQTTKQPYVQNNINIFIHTIEEGYQLLNIGLEKRRVGEQKINKRSSRGHGLITISVKMANGKSSRLCFVDLAGSERIKQSESTGKTLTQAVHINASLSALEALLMNIGEQSARVYRANKLTRLLQPFMESGKIRLIVTSNYENIQPLQFAKRCKGIRFMEREVVEPKMVPNSVATNSNVSNHNNAGSSRVGGKDNKQFQKFKRGMQKLEQQNKNLTQMLSNCLVLLNKISKLACNLMQQQNIQSRFSLNSDLSLSMVSQELESEINVRINQMQQVEQQIIEKCSEVILKNDKATDDSINTSVSLNNHAKNPSSNGQMSTVGVELQNIITLISQPQLMNKKIHEVGFGIFQTIKLLANLSEYKNIYKKQIFTYGIKAELLENKNKQFENAINYLLKYSGENVHGGISKKVIKELREMGVEVNDGSSQHQTNRSISRGKASNVSPISGKARVSVKNNVADVSQSMIKQHIEGESDDRKGKDNAKVNHQYNTSHPNKVQDRNQYQDCQMLFGNHENNAHNINRHLPETTHKEKQQGKTAQNTIVKKLEGTTKPGQIVMGRNTKNKDVAYTSQLSKNTKRNTGTILIEDL